MVDIMPVCMYTMHYRVAALWTKYTWLLKLLDRYYAQKKYHFFADFIGNENKKDV